MNNKGKGSGIFLIVILIVALIVAYLAVTQMSSLGFGKKKEAQIEQQNPVHQAQDAVDAINQRQQDAVDAINQRQQEAIEGLGLEEP
jgi:flagellar basal body-associated protein FliL